jgi:hypothetical protein
MERKITSPSGIRFDSPVRYMARIAEIRTVSPSPQQVSAVYPSPSILLSFVCLSCTPAIAGACTLWGLKSGSGATISPVDYYCTWLGSHGRREFWSFLHPAGRKHGAGGGGGEFSTTAARGSVLWGGKVKIQCMKHPRAVQYLHEPINQGTVTTSAGGEGGGDVAQQQE